MSKSISQRQYAQHRHDLGLPGGTPRAVQKAIASRRLKGSLTPDGKIRSVELADKEWIQNTDTRRAPITSASRICARERKVDALASLAEMKLAQEKAKFIDATECRIACAALVEHARVVILGISSRFAQRVPGVSAEQIALIDSLSREALDELKPLLDLEVKP